MMKKRVVLVFVVVMAIFSLTVAAAEMRYQSVLPEIGFSGGNAFCSVEVITGDSNAEIELYVELWEGDSMVDAWEESGTGYVEWSRSFSATSGETYTLVAYATVNGRDLSTKYATEVCP